jgi:hypothetical protein
MEAGLGRAWSSLRGTVVGITVLTAFAGCSSLTGLTDSQPPPAQPAATSGATPPPSAPPPQASAQPPASSPSPPPASPPPTATANASSNTSFTNRVKSWFVGDPTQSFAAAPNPTQASVDFDCPTVDYRQGAATLNVNDNKGDNPALNLKYLASFVKTARECEVHGDMVTIRVGVQGRVVVGPAGGPGTVVVPLRYALVHEGIEPMTLWTKLYPINVSVTNASLNVPFTHVEEEMTVPVPPATELAAYVIYIGFDPDGLKPAEKPKPAPRPKAARAK